MAPPSFDPDEPPPQWTFRREKLASDKSGALDVPISSSDLRGQRQEQFIQESFRKEISHQLWPTLDQDHVALADAIHRPQDSLGGECISCALHCRDLN